MSVAEAIDRYLRSGDSDPMYSAWPGSLFERAKRADDALLGALVAEVKRRAAGLDHPPVPNLDLRSWARRKLTPMVHGLFPQIEREAVLCTLEKSVVFLTHDSIEGVLLGQSWLRPAWDLANLFLGSMDAELLGPKAPRILGMSQETTCYVSAEYFSERGKMEDFVIHEAAHIFHNCKRRTVGLAETRTKEWLLHLEFMKRETFAYACEAYGWIVEHASNRCERLAMAKDFAKHGCQVNDETVDPEELADILRESCAARNGWKVILARCSPEKRSRTQQGAMASITE